jgi:hypothetical protein
MDMNAFRNYLSEKSRNQGDKNKPTHNVFGAVLSEINQSKTQEPSNNKNNDLITGRDILESFAIVDIFNDAVAEDIEDGEDVVEAIQECLEFLDENNEDDLLVLESFDVVDNFYTTVMESVGLNEESEDLDSLVEEVLQQIDLDEVYGTKLPSVSQGLSDEEKRKVQKGETSKMPKSGVQDKIPGEKQSSVDAVTAVLGSKKNTVSDSSY